VQFDDTVTTSSRLTMRLNRLTISLAILCLLPAAAQAAGGGGGWKGAKIMPKSDQLMIQGGATSGAIYDMMWPAVVEQTNGRWLWIRDEGGGREQPVAGWVYADDILKVDEARDYYSELIRGDAPAWVYWLRGIVWESQREPGIAKLDYQKAAERDNGNRIDDLHIRLGRLTAQDLFLTGPPHRYGRADKEAIERHFNAVSNVRRPQLYLEWGAALSLACKCHQKAMKAGGNGQPAEAIPGPAGKASETQSAGPPTDPEFDDVRDTALKTIGKARTLNRGWWRVAMAEGEMWLDLCRQDSGEGVAKPINNADPQNPSKADYSPDKEIALRVAKPIENVKADDLARAVTKFNEAIALNPNSPDAYRDRAEVIRLQANLPDEKLHLPPGAAESAAARKRHMLQEAKQSASTACNMTLYRQPQSLRVLAEICGDLGDFKNAAKYANSAGEYASEDDAEQLKGLSKAYLAKLTIKDPTLASTLHQLYTQAALGPPATGAAPETPREPELYSIPRSLSAWGD
jgi:tetratricopeptide (TPR) repeat protein